MGNKLRVSGPVLILAALMLLVLPLKWLLAAAVAALIHEAFHILAIRLCGGSVRAVRIGRGGAVLDAEPMTRGKEAICALAGPLGGLLLLLLAKQIPRIALCAAVQSLYNLFPVYPLDGGRALRCLAEQWFGEKAARSICQWSEGIFSICVALLGLYGTFCLGLGLFPLLPAGFLLLRIKSGKIPCKERAKGVQ